MGGKFPAASFARTLTSRQLSGFLAMPVLRTDPVRAVRSFSETIRRQRT